MDDPHYLHLRKNFNIKYPILSWKLLTKFHLKHSQPVCSSSCERLDLVPAKQSKNAPICKFSRARKSPSTCKHHRPWNAGLAKHAACGRHCATIQLRAQHNHLCAVVFTHRSPANLVFSHQALVGVWWHEWTAPQHLFFKSPVNCIYSNRLALDTQSGPVLVLWLL